MGWLSVEQTRAKATADYSSDIFNSISQPFIALDRRIRILSVNPAFIEAFYKWTGVRLSVGMNYLDALPEVTLPERLKLWRKALSGEKISIEQDYMLDGDRRTFLVTYDPLISGGKIVGIIGSAKDINEQKLVQQSLKEATQKFQNIFKYAMIGMCRTEPSGRFIQVNPTMVKMLGYSEEELLKKTFMDITHPDDLATNLEVADKLWTGDIECMRLNKRYCHKDGHYIHVQVFASVILDEASCPLYAVAAIQDMTDTVQTISLLEQTKEDLRRKADELGRSNKELEQFAYVASHDLQEPLRMIASYLQFLDLEYRSKLSPQADEYLHYAVDGAKRMSNLIRDLLAYSRLGRQDLKFEVVNLSEVVQAACANLRPLIHETGAQIAHEGGVEVWGDRPQLNRLFQNLLENSLKYRSTVPPKIAIVVKENARDFEVVVSDNGIGFDQKDAARAFKIFQCLHDRDKYSGSGIGLSIAQAIVQRHGGRIWAESQVDHGTQIYFTLEKRPVQAFVTSIKEPK